MPNAQNGQNGSMYKMIPLNEMKQKIIPNNGLYIKKKKDLISGDNTDTVSFTITEKGSHMRRERWRGRQAAFLDK